ncbi:MAG: response regulator transcription factor [Spirochaetes bacterium]|nr:response regulator transcription factor [Spirochaetota bacterium]
MKKKIYILDDEEEILEIIKINLDSAGYETRTFSKPSLAKTELAKGSIPDLFILDIMMPEEDGYEFCRYVKSKNALKDIPVIFLSAKTEEFDKVLGLELGADDYVPKPFSVKELSSRVKAVLRRCSGSKEESANQSKVLTYKGLSLFTEEYRLNVDGTDIKLTKTEFEILGLFLRHPGKIFSRDNIIDSIRGNDIYVVDRTIDVHIMNLRKKIGSYKNIVTTFSGVGYGFKQD